MRLHTKTTRANASTNQFLQQSTVDGDKLPILYSISPSNGDLGA